MLPPVDASGTIHDHTPELRLAIARVEASLRVVLTAIREIQREMGINTSIVHDVPLRPDPSWIGTP